MPHKTPSRDRSSSRMMIVFSFLAGLWMVFAAESRPTANTNPLGFTLLPKDVFLQAQNDATDEIWRQIPEHSVQLHIAPAVHQSIALRRDANQDVQPLFLQVRAISDGEHICFRLRWNDETENQTSLVGKYRDAAALQFPRNAETAGIMMGSPDSPVYIWFWKADTNGAEELMAGGPGTVSSSPGRSQARGIYQQRSNGHAGQWLVVFSQKLSDAGKRIFALDKRGSLPVAFAVWRGEEEQRDGHKYVSDWHELHLDSLHAAR